MREMELDVFTSMKNLNKTEENHSGYILLNPPSDTLLHKGDIL